MEDPAMLTPPQVLVSYYGFGAYRVALDCGAVYETDSLGRPLYLDRLGWWVLEEKLSQSYNPLEVDLIKTALRDFHHRLQADLSTLAHVSQRDAVIERFNGPLW